MATPEKLARSRASILLITREKESATPPSKIDEPSPGSLFAVALRTKQQRRVPGTGQLVRSKPAGANDPGRLPVGQCEVPMIQLANAKMQISAKARCCKAAL